MEIIEKISQIKVKLDELAKKDKGFRTFGSNLHRYQINPKLSDVELNEFEIKHQIQLPEGYREFLKQIGNGGAGPYYGLQPLQNGLFASLDDKDPNKLVELSREFPFTEPWNANVENIPEEQFDDIFEKEYNHPQLQYGILRLANFGCGVSINLIVNGKEYGNIWVDDRMNQQGIYPDYYFGNDQKIDFLQWYEMWLDISLSQFNKKKSKK